MDLRHNINKIHSDVTSLFFDQEIKIEEKSNLKFGKFFELSITNEGKELKTIIPFTTLDNTYNFNWSYFSNPLDENSVLVERSSSLDNFASDVKDIFEKNRFSKEYLSELNKN